MGDYSGHQQPLVAIEADWQPLYKRLDEEKGPGGCQRPMSLILYTCTSTKELAEGKCRSRAGTLLCIGYTPTMQWGHVPC